MNAPAKTTLKESLLVGGGFILWFGFGIAIESRGGDSFGVSFFAGSLIFFIIAFLIAERPRGAFISRSQVLGVAAFFLWLGTSQLFYLGDYKLISLYESANSRMVFGMVSILFPFVFYWGSVFLIRGYHADPVYPEQKEAEAGREWAPGGPP